MVIRKAHNADIPEIVNLLKKSLGERLLPKTEVFWIWKHIENPFGKSLLLVAEVEGQIIGVRAFMKWEWKSGDKIWKTLRAVDTAIHPNYQGQGIFTKLTKTLLTQAAEENFDFVFNTPNKKSMPGYLKMGWVKLGYAPVQIQLNFNFRNKKKKISKEIDENKFKKISSKLTESNSELISKNINSKFLIWRYVDCPQYNYQFLTDDVTYFLVYRIRETTFGRELRVLEIFPISETMEINLNSVNKEIKMIQKEFGITFSSFMKSKNIKLPKFISLPALSILPMITLKRLTLEEGFFQELMNLNQWQFTLGDLELF